MSNSVNLNNNNITYLTDLNDRNKITNTNNTFASNSNDIVSYSPYQSLSYSPLFVLYQAPLYKPYKISTIPPSNVNPYLPYQSPSLELKETPVSSSYQEPTNIPYDIFIPNK
jgi:hypothetical protein